jgi:zinc and cadmium transporter
MVTILYSLGAVIVVSLVSFVGVFAISIKEEILRKYLGIFISLAIGALLGDAFIHIIPEAFENSVNTSSTSFLIICGLLLFFILEKFLHWHHHGEDKDADSIHPVGKLILFSDGVHNFIDGILIGASFMVSVPIGIATTVAVILHEIPQEIGDFAVLIHAGYSKKKALWFNFLSALLAVLGLSFVFILGEVAEVSTAWLMPITAGGFIYIAMTDLVPELHKHKGGMQGIFQIITVVIGAGVMFALTFLE